MPDETQRSTHGNPPDQRRDGAPAWWAELPRADLPDGPDGRTRGGRRRPRSAQPWSPPSPAPSRPVAWVRSTILGIAVAAVAMLIAWVGIGGGSSRSVAVAALVFGVPAGLAALSATAVVRRSR